MPIEHGAMLICDCCGASKFARRINTYMLDPKDTSGWSFDKLTMISALCPACSRVGFRGLWAGNEVNTNRTKEE